MEQHLKTIKWRAPKDFARHRMTLDVRWMGLWLLWVLVRNLWNGQVSENFEIFMPLFMLAMFVFVNWANVPRYILGEKEVQLYDSRGNLRVRYDAIRSYRIRSLSQIFPLKIVDFGEDDDSDISKKKRLSSFVFDPRELDETQLRAFLAEKLPNKEIAAQEPAVEYSDLGVPLMEWKEPLAGTLKSFFWVLGLVAIIGSLLFGVFFAMRKIMCCGTQTSSASPAGIVGFMGLFGLYLLATHFLGRNRFTLCENGLKVREGGKEFRILWRAVNSFILLPEQPNKHSATISLFLREPVHGVGDVLLSPPLVQFDLRKPKHRRALEIIREKLPSQETEYETPRNIIEILEGDKLAAQ